MTTKQLIEKLQSLPDDMQDYKIVFMDKYDNIHDMSNNIDVIEFYPKSDCVYDSVLFIREW